MNEEIYMDSKSAETQEYVCKYLVTPSQGARRVYWAADWAGAMIAHNRAMPEFADKVISWECPTGLIMQMHDSRLI